MVDRSSAFSELFERPGVLLPTLFSVVFVISLFLVAASGQVRLAESAEQTRAAEYRARLLAEFMRQMVESETAVRGFVITGDPQYLAPHHEAKPAALAMLDALDVAYASLPVGDESLPRMRRLADTRLALLDQVASRRAQGFEPAALLVRTNVGKRTMDQLRQEVAVLVADERRIFDQVQARAATDLVQGRWLLGLGALLNVLLVVLAGTLVSRDLKRRAELAESLEDQRQRLETEVGERTAELEALSTHLQSVSEQERSSLARELHDELGSLLVAARMDLSWLQRRLPTDDPAIRLRWQRIQDSLDAGVNLKRRVVEQLRPTLLDNMGLFAALRWQLQESCGGSGIRCAERYPDPEPVLTAAASIAIFRLVQEALTNILKHARAHAVDLEVIVDPDTDALLVHIADDGVGIPTERTRGLVGSHGLASMRHRMTALGGTFDIRPGATRGTVLTVRLPLSVVLERERRGQEEANGLPEGEAVAPL